MKFNFSIAKKIAFFEMSKKQFKRYVKNMIHTFEISNGISIYDISDSLLSTGTCV
jgi:hypothetical protein